MWLIRDNDAPIIIAEKFYKYLIEGDRRMCYA
jgi:hypothetical protein